MNWLRIAAGAFVGLVVLFFVVIMIGEALENGKSYYGSYGQVIRGWAVNVATCLFFVGLVVLFIAALTYALWGRL